MRIADMERYVIDISKGLVEFSHHEAQFIHQSVRDFVFRPNELQRLYGVQDRKEFQAQSQEMLRDWLLAELIAPISRSATSSRTKVQLNWTTATLKDGLTTPDPSTAHCYVLLGTPLNTCGITSSLLTSLAETKQHFSSFCPDKLDHTFSRKQTWKSTNWGHSAT
jgi:hypothetical protein